MPTPEGQPARGVGPEPGGRASEVLVLSPEQDILVRAAAPPGTHVHPAPTSRASVGWEQLVRLAEWHRLSALLWRYLHHDGRDLSAPSGVLGDLRQVAAATTVRNLIRQAELDRILAALAEVGIPAMLLKGTALIEAVYPNIGMRPMEDIDILVPRSSVQDAHGAVQALGYAVWGVKLGRHDGLASVAASPPLPARPPGSDGRTASPHHCGRSGV